MYCFVCVGLLLRFCVCGFLGVFFWGGGGGAGVIIIIIDNFCIALFSGVPKLTAINTWVILILCVLDTDSGSSSYGKCLS